MRKRWTRIWICMALAIGALGLSTGARASDDTVRFYGAWITNFVYNGQMVITESVHDGNGYKNYVRLPAGVTPAGNGNFSAANGKWTAAAAAPNDSGTYKFTDDDTAVCTNSAGQTVTWRRDDAPLPDGIAPPNYQQVMAAYLPLANSAVTSAMNMIGDMYLYAQGVALDYTQAMGWYQKAAAGGDTAAMTSVGYFYDQGLGVTRDYQQAMAWYLRGAAGGSATAMMDVGELYQNGLGVAQNYQQAMSWYSKGANGDNPNALNQIGYLYQNGLGVARNYQEAMSWYTKAADAGDGVAMGNVANLYLNGMGVSANRDEAVAWYRAGASAGDTVSQKWLKQNGLL